MSSAAKIRFGDRLQTAVTKADGFVGVATTVVGLCWLVLFMIRTVFSYIVLIGVSIPFLEDASPAAIAASFVVLTATGLATFALAGTRSIEKRIVLAAACTAAAAYHLFFAYGIGATATVVWCAACAVWHLANGIVAPFENRKEAVRRKHMIDEANSQERNERDDNWLGSDPWDLGDGATDRFRIPPNRANYCPACGSRLVSETIGVMTCGRCGTKFRVITY